MGKYGLNLLLLDLKEGEDKILSLIKKEDIKVCRNFDEKVPDLVISDSLFVLERGRRSGFVTIALIPDEADFFKVKADLIVQTVKALDLATLYRVFCHSKKLPYVIGENEVLLVRELSAQDVNDYISIQKEEHIIKFLPDGAEGEDEQRERLLSYIDTVYAFYDFGIYGIFLKSEKRLIGAVSLDLKGSTGVAEYEVGFFISHYYLGCGYGIMGLEFLLDFAFFELEVKRLISITASSNLHAINLLEKAGFVSYRKEENRIYFRKTGRIEGLKIEEQEKDMKTLTENHLLSKNQQGRGAGILLSISSLPGEYGIGCFSKEAYNFIDELEAAGQKYWQLLPLGPTSYGDSPYQSFSTFAGNPYFIDPNTLIEKNWISKETCDSFDFGEETTSVDYEKVYQNRFQLLKIAFQNSGIKENSEFTDFVKKNEEWLADYALFMAIKDAEGGTSWTEWEEDIRLRKPEALAEYKEKFSEEISFYEFLQFEFVTEWTKIKAYANEKGISIIGDLPIYVALDSSDTWANPELFKLDGNMKPVVVAGCPPDAFSADGQLWGNPIYDWTYHEKTGYEWWLKRIRHCFALYDVVRIDHFRGFDEYYEIPFPAENAKKGAWEAGPGFKLFQKAKEEMGHLNIIAEDLGFLTESVFELVEKTGFPGMKVLQFAFDPREESDYLPHNYHKNSIVYTGTHDNDTTVSWYRTISEEDREFLHEYLNLSEDVTAEEATLALIRASYASVSKVAVIPMQDVLTLDGSARMNKPSTLGGNWEWRMEKGAFSKTKQQQLAKLASIYRR